MTIEALDKDGNVLGTVPTPPEWQQQVNENIRVIDNAKGESRAEANAAQTESSPEAAESTLNPNSADLVEDHSSNDYTTPEDITLDVDDSLDPSNLNVVEPNTQGLLSPVIWVFLFLGTLIAVS